MSVCRTKRAGIWYVDTPACAALRCAALEVRLWSHDETLPS